MAFGNPKKYIQLDIPKRDIPRYQAALTKHDLCCNNCHHHVAHVLNEFQYRERNNWTQVSIWWMCLTESKYVSWWAPIVVYLPFVLIVVAIVLASTLTKK